MTWNAAVGVLFAAVPGAPSQELPPPTLPPVTVTIPLPGSVTETTVDGSVSVSVSADLPLPLSGESIDTQPTAPIDTTDTTDATQHSPTSPAMSPAPDDTVVDRAPPSGPAPHPRPGHPNAPHRRQPAAAPLLQQPRTQLLGAASDAAGEFAPAGAVAALVGLALVADGLIRRRDDLAGMRLDDRDAIVRFE